MQKRRKKIAFLGTDWKDNEYRFKNNAYGGCGYYRLIKPMELLTSYDVVYYGSNFKDLAEGMSTDTFYDKFTKDHDMIIMKNVDNPIACQAMIHWCMVNGTILVQDYDDNMLAIRDDQPASNGGYGKGGSKKAYSASMMSLVDSLIVSTDNLKDNFTKFLKMQFNEKKDIYVFPNFNDVGDWNYPVKEKDGYKITIGWAGSITHDADLMMVMPALEKVLLKYANVHLKLIGGVSAGKLAQLTSKWSIEARKKVTMSYGVEAWDKYPELIMNQNWDIGIAPLVDEEFNRGKSNIKWMEYAMANIPCIVSEIVTYDVVEHGKTGLIANPHQWEEMLCQLIENKTLREDLARKAKAFILKKMQYKQHAKEYQKIVADIFKKNAHK